MITLHQRPHGSCSTRSRHSPTNLCEPSSTRTSITITREMLTGGKSAEMPLYKNYLTGLPGQIATLRQRVAAEADATAKARLQTQLQTAENNAASQAELNPTPP